MSKKYGHVIEFYGETCPHCIAMKPVIAEIESATGAKIEKLEVWNNEENARKMESHSKIIGEACGGFAGVPAFVNVDTNQALCGAHDKEDIIRLLEGEDCTNNVCKPHTKNNKK
ncbi:MAG: thioredoxin family protein [bacterium]